MNKLLSIVNSIVPKGKIIIFNSFPDASGNSLALYEYIVKERKDLAKRYKLVWCIGGDNTEKVRSFLEKRTGEKSHNVVKKKSFLGIMLYFISKYIVSTHGYFPGIKTASSQTHVNLWHGMPFKRIGRLLEEVHTNGKSDEADITISTSSVFTKLMAQSFGIDEKFVLMTGQPCNDSLFENNESLEMLGIKKNRYKKIVMWMPTYRKSAVGDIRVDGKVDSFGVSTIISFYREDFEKHLKDLGILLIIKPHPMDILCQQGFQQTDYIKIIKNEDLEAKDIVLYDILAETDGLLTDYSSVFIDYMVTRKPMAFICDDLDEYSNSRGFCFEPPRDYMPGEVIGSYEELIEYLSNIDINALKWKSRYESIKEHLNCQEKPDSCKKVCSALWNR